MKTTEVLKELRAIVDGMKGKKDEKNQIFQNQFKTYTTYRLPRHTKALICTLVVMLVLSVALNIYIVLANAKKEPQRVTEVYPATTEVTTRTTMEENMITIEGIIETKVCYYDVPLSYELQDHIRQLAAYYGIDMALVLAVIEIESGYRADVISEGGDYGLMQISSFNHEWLSEEYDFDDYFDPYQNCAAGVLMLSQAIESTDTMHGALMVYNCGLSRAQELWANGVYQTGYSKKVIEKYEEIRSEK